MDFKNFIAKVKYSIQHQKPFSYIRIGDGEGIVLGFPRYISEHKLCGRLDKWFGSKYMNHHERIDFSVHLGEACRDADVLGLPQERHMKLNQDWRNVLIFCRELNLIRHESGSMDWVMQIDYKDLLENQDVLCISCRNVENRLKEKFKIRQVKSYFTAPQNRPHVGPNLSNGKRHYPDMYKEIHKFLYTNIYPGVIALVGAGGLGKIYCAYAKQCGAVALDIGSMFDAWSGCNTRSHIRKSGGRWKL